jgi:polyisoprenoid-binding protein YceI
VTARTFAAALAALTIASTAPADTLKFNNTASRTEFACAKKGGTYTGHFKRFAGTITTSGGDLAQSRVAFEIELDSLKADSDKFTALLQSPDFFDVHNHPTVKFVSRRIRAVSGDGPESHLILGDLTFHGVTHDVRIPVAATATPSGLKLTGEFVIHRKDFGMSAGEKAVSDEIKLKLTLQAGR